VDWEISAALTWKISPKHKMDSEQIWIRDEACEVVNHAKDEKKNICAVGTTVMQDP
jgi:S-adenosylmethionine:tRNA-ribosyltransferase-isomerase (queuine synthetase)